MSRKRARPSDDYTFARQHVFNTVADLQSFARRPIDEGLYSVPPRFRAELEAWRKKERCFKRDLETQTRLRSRPSAPHVVPRAPAPPLAAPISGRVAPRSSPARHEPSTDEDVMAEFPDIEHPGEPGLKPVVSETEGWNAVGSDGSGDEAGKPKRRWCSPCLSSPPRDGSESYSEWCLRSLAMSDSSASSAVEFPQSRAALRRGTSPVFRPRATDPPCAVPPVDDTISGGDDLPSPAASPGGDDLPSPAASPGGDDLPS
eukprot:Hpha_TRINITY_DN9931_c0_g1::TRINITY_DN9931_c0_g1_i1::g.140591::m.140591